MTETPKYKVGDVVESRNCDGSFDPVVTVIEVIDTSGWGEFNHSLAQIGACGYPYHKGMPVYATESEEGNPMLFVESELQEVKS